MLLEVNAAELTGRGRTARTQNRDSGHTGTISSTARVRRASWNVMKPGSSAS